MTALDLIARRQALGLTITAMAERLNTPRSSYIKWERGERRVPGIVEVAITNLGKKNQDAPKK